MKSNIELVKQAGGQHEHTAYEEWVTLDIPDLDRLIALVEARQIEQLCAGVEMPEPVARVNDEGFIIECNETLIAPGVERITLKQ
jgi:hypothetical protein